jgi:hypothetical protein
MEVELGKRMKNSDLFDGLYTYIPWYDPSDWQKNSNWSEWENILKNLLAKPGVFERLAKLVGNGIEWVTFGSTQNGFYVKLVPQEITDKTFYKTGSTLEEAAEKVEKAFEERYSVEEAVRKAAEHSQQNGFFTTSYFRMFHIAGGEVPAEELLRKCPIVVEVENGWYVLPEGMKKSEKSPSPN